jgi:transposase
MEVGGEVGEVASGRRRYWTAEEKRRIVELTLSSSRSVASLARQHGVNANQVFYWRKLYHAGQLGGESSADAPGLRLLPVSMGNEEPSEAEASETERGTHESAEPPLTMNIEFPGGALVSLAGAVDAEIVRAVLESMRG